MSTPCRVALPVRAPVGRGDPPWGRGTAGVDLTWDAAQVARFVAGAMLFQVMCAQ